MADDLRRAAPRPRGPRPARRRGAPPRPCRDRPPGRRAAARPASAASRRPVSARSRSARTIGGSASDDRPNVVRSRPPTAPQRGSSGTRSGRARIARLRTASPTGRNGRGGAGAPAGSGLRSLDDGIGPTRTAGCRRRRRPSASSRRARRSTPGARVRAGDRLAVVDLLGVPQDVVAPDDGVVVDVLVNSGEGVEYGQDLMLIEPAVRGRHDGDDDAGGADATDGTGPADDGAGARDAPARTLCRARRRRDGVLMVTRVLIANRGEIALRILRACRALRLPAVVAYSEADRESLPVQLADEAICIGPADARRSYLSAPAVISAAIVTGCDAIHPGYGFLSEDAGFADAVRAHDLTFIGPSAEVLERFASKEATRRLLARYGLPTIPGSDGMLRDDHHALAEADRIGYPVLIKPSAGGGGKGMRMVRSPRELEAALQVCRSEARAAFGDDSPLPRALARGEPPRRGPGRGGPLRPRRPHRRARLLRPAPPPEDHRGGPDARPSTRPLGPSLRSGRCEPSSRPATRTWERSSSSSTRTATPTSSRSTAGSRWSTR